MANIIRLQPQRIPLPKIGIIVAARMSSVRFPGKSMALLDNKPVLQWVLERAKKIRGPKKHKVMVILAVPDVDISEPMLQLADKLEVDNFCGSELNVLKRYYEASRFFGLDIIMRITGDCVFIDPVACSQVLQLLIWRKLDYSSNVYPTRSYPKGLDCECFTFDALEAAYQLSDQIMDYEHVTPWLQRTKEIKKGNVVQKIDKSSENWTVDFPEDIYRLEQEIKKLNLKGANDDAIVS